MIFLSEFHHKTILTAFLLSNFGFKKLKTSKSVQFEVLLIQIPNFEGSFHSVQYDESIHAPDLRIRFFLHIFEKLKSYFLVFGIWFEITKMAMTNRKVKSTKNVPKQPKS
jgi:hypothetical protein